MSSTAYSSAAIDNLADLVKHLGGVPLERIRMQPPPGSATEDDVVVALKGKRKRLCELIDGVLVEKPVGFAESVIATTLLRILDGFVHTHNLGIVAAPDGTIRLWVGRVRIPDVAFYSWDRLPGRRIPTEPIPSLAPDLAVEIVSATNTAGEMRTKRSDYFASGVRRVWEIDPETRTAAIFTDVDSCSRVSAAGTLEGGDVLPGLSIALADVFIERAPDKAGSGEAGGG
jgi:Uma2 family endonuclease